MEKDNCSICHGDNGGTPGNENVIDGVLMCDYCHLEYRVESDPEKTES